ncbi:MAG: hypothetical protein KDA87_23775 [Planctomycetales bacterium]|nr:hypothetical protein [Planctomycetales bacterium]
MKVGLGTSFCRTLFLIGTLAAATQRPVCAGVISDYEVGPYQTIRPVSASLVTDAGLVELGSQAYDGDGLTNSSPLFALHGNEADSMLQVPFTDGSPSTVQFDLGGQFNIHEIWLWQFNDAQNLDVGVSDVEFVFRDEDGNVVGGLTGGVSMGRGDLVKPYYFCPFGECVRFIDVILKDNFGDLDLVGFSEIVFAGREKVAEVPEPWLGATSMLALLFLRRRRK